MAWGPPRFGGSRFFCLLCLNNYSKIFQKRRISILLLGGTRVGLPPWGGPPEVPGAPQGSPGVTELWKKLQKFPKIIWKLYMHQNTSNYNSDIHFRPPGLLGGSWEGQNGFLASPGGNLEARAPIFFLSVLYWPIEQDWGGPEAKFWFHLFITTA